MIMITEVCQDLKNWFDRGQPKYYGKFKIENGILRSYNDGDMGILDGQYFRIIGSIFNDGVHTLDDTLDDEVFDGAVWLMAVPKSFIALIEDMKAWQNKYGGIDSENMSPYNSESFGGYSYSKGGSGSGGDSNGNITWQSKFRSQLNRWRKI